MNQAEQLYDYCMANHLGRGFNKSWGIKHFQLLIDNLMPNEKLASVFIGMHNYISATKHDNYYAFGITDKRIICAQKGVIGEKVQSIKWTNINDITLDKGLMIGVVDIDTYKEIVRVGVAKSDAQNIYDSIMDVHDKLERQKLKTSQTHPVQSSDNNFEKLKQLKELLDMGIITKDEFELKKKQLLGL